MAIRLHSFQYLPLGPEGWQSGRLNFGKLLTAVLAENGMGKTVIMKGIAFALGHEIELPPIISSHCALAKVELRIDGRPVLIQRRLAGDFDLEVFDGESPRKFSDQSEYARWFTEIIGAQARILTSKSKNPISLYINALLPALWVDQDQGWATDYWTPPHRNFIQDQKQEVVRFLLGLPPRHPYRSRDSFEAAKENLARTERSIELQRFVIKRLKENVPENFNEQELSARRSELQLALAAHGESLEAIRSSSSHFDRALADLESKQQELQARQGNLAKRKGQLTLVLSELESEEKILTANVQATEFFRNYCPHQGCPLFSTTERSFGRSLLFLKDQVKDLLTSDENLSRDSHKIEEQLSLLESAIATSRADRDRSMRDSPQAELIAKLNILTKGIVEIELQLARIRQISVEEDKFERLLDQREQQLTAVSEEKLRGSRSANSADDASVLLREAMERWLETLGTTDIASVSFDTDFNLIIDYQKFGVTTHLSGSTRTRVVLAYHAAILEVALAKGGNHPGWLLLDAPRQHELKKTDFESYVNRFRLLDARHPGRIQVVFSATGLESSLQDADEVWTPIFTDAQGKAKFLGLMNEPSPI